MGNSWLTPHMPIGFPSSSSGRRFLLNFLPPVECKQLAQHDSNQHQHRQEKKDPPPLVGLLNLPPRPRPPGAMFASCCQVVVVVSRAVSCSTLQSAGCDPKRLE